MLLVHSPGHQVEQSSCQGDLLPTPPTYHSLAHDEPAGIPRRPVFTTSCHTPQPPCPSLTSGKISDLSDLTVCILCTSTVAVNMPGGRCTSTLMGFMEFRASSLRAYRTLSDYKQTLYLLLKYKTTFPILTLS